MLNPEPTNLFHAIFDQAVAIKEKAERDVFLAEQCGEDEALRSQLSGMFSALNDAGSFLDPNSKIKIVFDSSRLGAEFANSASNNSKQEKFGVGTRVGPYQLTRELGSGGFGEVLSLIHI